MAWDDSDSEKEPEVVIPVNKPGKWDDEDVEEDVQDNWDASSEDEKKPTPKSSNASSAANSPKPKKKGLKAKIAEREEAERKRLEALRLVKQQEAEESPAERRKRLQEEVEKSDFKNAVDLFGPSPSDGKTAPKKSDQSILTSMVPNTKEDFDEYIAALGEKAKTFEKNRNYPYFVESLTRELCGVLTLDQTRKVSTILNTQINEKQKAFSSKKKKKAAPKLKMVQADNDTTNYGDELMSGQYDDFM